MITPTTTYPCPHCSGTGLITHHTELRRIRLSVGLSLKSVAISLNNSSAYVSDVELGKRPPTARIVSFYNELKKLKPKVNP